MTVEHNRTAEHQTLPVRTPQRELRLRRALEELPPAGDLFADADREYLSAPGIGENRLPRRRAGGEA